jgi:hypothetical protein
MNRPASNVEEFSRQRVQDDARLDLNPCLVVDALCFPENDLYVLAGLECGRRAQVEDDRKNEC